MPSPFFVTPEVLRLLNRHGANLPDPLPVGGAPMLSGSVMVMPHGSGRIPTERVSITRPVTEIEPVNGWRRFEYAR